MNCTGKEKPPKTRTGWHVVEDWALLILAVSFSGVVYFMQFKVAVDILQALLSR